MSGPPKTENEEDDASSCDEISEVDHIKRSQFRSRSNVDSENESILDPSHEGSLILGAGFLWVGRR